MGCRILADIGESWAKSLRLMEKAISGAVFTSIIEKLQPLGFENGVLTLKTNMDFFKPSINRYHYEITSCLRSVLNSDVDIRIVSPEDFNPAGAERRADDHFARTNLQPKYAFETFVKGKCNELAYAAALAVAEAPGKTGYNPLFLYGGVGLGKTHLIHSIGNHVVEQNPALKVLYVTTETFTSEFISAIMNKRTQEFKNKYRECEVLLLDDVQFLEGRVETQEEMYNTFNSLYDAGKQLVMTSDLPPKELASLEKRLTSRFAMGLTVDVTMPDYETRAAILEKKLDMEHIYNIPKEVKEFIIRNIVSNVRDLEGAINKVTAYARLTNAQITLELAEMSLRDHLVGNQKPDITVSYIQEIVAEYYNLTTIEINGRRRTQNVVYPRQIAMYLSYKILTVSLPKLGELFGGRDHSTVIHSCNKIATEMENDPRLRSVVNDLERRIKGE